VGDRRSDVEWRLFVCDIRNVHVHARVDTSKIFNEGAQKQISTRAIKQRTWGGCTLTIVSSNRARVMHPRAQSASRTRGWRRDEWERA
jgi:hypothetical protein